MAIDPGLRIKHPIQGAQEPTEATRQAESYYMGKIQQEYSEAVARANQANLSYRPDSQAMMNALYAAQQHFQSYALIAADLARKGCPALACRLKQIESDIDGAMGIQQQTVQDTLESQLNAQKTLDDAAAKAATDFAQSTAETNRRAEIAIQSLIDNQQF